jgi:hypothetical protein
VACVPFVVAGVSNLMDRTGSTRSSPLILLILCRLSEGSSGGLSGFG